MCVYVTVTYNKKGQEWKQQGGVYGRVWWEEKNMRNDATVL